jgi:hypothetical protein
MAYQNNASQKEREEVLRSTFQSRAIAEADEVRGRWTEINKSNVVGATPTVDYPRLPSGPWADPVQVPPEPSLGFSVEDHEPVGTIQEIEASLGAHSASPCAHNDTTALDAVVSSAGVGEPSIVGDPSDDVEPPPAPAIPNPKSKRGV